ncbi:phosphoribosylglycinamide formyltransferase [Gulosibacter molinativorax]|uniref:Phosphoribosylglycinamide formyltransferase n=1 Tax=Gulosibacter molinativorax TaxID=256821 RepID=A0ABT7C448_9MICO|nr:phosphoribosylglycinamide formyltransferase [Gulosibacter molinativorax]MDJ1369998.1 phosphoribosylglycinamide formyltransferase [Gulosibacter molinativorax]QUY63812.1 Phosphoribosylglycinamide formyltransferase [Gulosibacter molinativorax]
MLKLVVLISGTGSNLRALLDAIDTSRDSEQPIDAEVVAIGADTPKANLALATERGIPTFVIEPRNYPNREAWGDALLAEIQRWEPDTTILSGFMRLVPPRVVEALSPNLLNTHPAHLPEFPGAHAVRDALAAGVTETGATIMIVDNGVDTGPIIDQRRIPIHPDDDQDALHERIKIVERELLTETVRNLALGTINLKEIAA